MDDDAAAVHQAINYTSVLYIIYYFLYIISLFHIYLLYFFIIFYIFIYLLYNVTIILKIKINKKILKTK